MRTERQILIFGTVVLIFAMTGCGDTQEQTSVEPEQSATQSDQEQTDQEQTADQLARAQETFPGSPFLQILDGELTRVDTKAKTLSVKSSEGQETEFRYNDQTQMSGTESRVEGLADKSPTQVRVHFDGASMTATRIEVRQQQ